MPKAITDTHKKFVLYLTIILQLDKIRRQFKYADNLNTQTIIIHFGLREGADSVSIFLVSLLVPRYNTISKTPSPKGPQQQQ
jgi:hypothetical protein